MIQQLGVNGMSSDESDYEELPGNPPARLRSPRYYVLKPRWRHPQLSEWLETFDMIYSIIRRVQMSRRGAYARQRQRNGITTRYSGKKSYVRGLSISTYDPVWLDSCGDVDFTVHPSQEAYSFTHDPEVIRWVIDVLDCLDVFLTLILLFPSYIQTTSLETLQDIA